MTLTLVADPGNGNVVQHPSGLVVLRAEDFVGGARGDLTTSADSSSVAGTVVVDTQAFVVPSTLASAGTGASALRRFALAANTLEIPIATLSPLLSANTFFQAMVTLKVEGDVPSNARYKKTHSYYGVDQGGAAAGMAWGRDTTFISGVNIQTEFYGDQFKVTMPLQIGWSTVSGNTDLVLRIWGVTGGTMSYSLDLVYLMTFGGDLRLRHNLGNYPVLDLGTNGSVDIDQDNDDTDNIIGKFSVGTVSHAAGVEGFSVPTDFQEAGDEPTAYNITDGDWTGPMPTTPDDPKSWLSFIAAPQYIPETTLINDPFAGAALGTSGVTFATTEGYILTGSGGNFGGPGHPNGTSGWTRDGAGNIRCSIVNSAASGTGTYAGFFPHADLTLGVLDIISGSASDPRNYQHTLLGLEDATVETTFACDTASGEVNLLVGFRAFSGNAFPIDQSFLDNSYGCRLSLSGGVLEAALMVVEEGAITSPTPTNGTIQDFSSTSTVDAAYAANTVYRVKVERRRYRMRAKVWLDGTSEPGSWTFDEYMPFRWLGGGNEGFIDYEYDTNWSGDTDHDTVEVDIWYTAQQSIAGMTCWPNVTTPNQVVRCSEYILTVEPEGTTPVDMLVAEENNDGSSRSNDVTVPYATIPSARFVEGSLRKRHFSSDSLGFNLLGWKDGAGGPEMQASALPIAWELGVLGEFLPQIYRLVIF